MHDDITYWQQRIEHTRMQAMRATDPAIGNIHQTLTSLYAERLEELRRSAGDQSMR